MLLLSIVRWGIRLLPFVYMGFIWYLSSEPSDSVVRFGPYDSLIKESLHLVEFAILYGFWVLAFLTFGELSKRSNRIAVALSIVYAFVDEFHQSFVPSRSATVIDLVKDVIGVCAVWYIVHRTYFHNNQTKIGRSLKRITTVFAPTPSKDRPHSGNRKD